MIVTRIWSSKASCLCKRTTIPFSSLCCESAGLMTNAYENPWDRGRPRPLPANARQPASRPASVPFSSIIVRPPVSRQTLLKILGARTSCPHPRSGVPPLGGIFRAPARARASARNLAEPKSMNPERVLLIIPGSAKRHPGLEIVHIPEPCRGSTYSPSQGCRTLTGFQFLVFLTQGGAQ